MVSGKGNGFHARAYESALVTLLLALSIHDTTVWDKLAIDINNSFDRQSIDKAMILHGQLACDYLTNYLPRQGAKMGIGICPVYNIGYYLPQIKSELISLLDNSHTTVRMRAAEVLMMWGVDYACPAIFDVLVNDPDINVRRFIAHQLSISNLKLPHLIPEIEKLIGIEQDSAVKQSLLETIHHWRQYEQNIVYKIRQTLEGQVEAAQPLPDIEMRDETPPHETRTPGSYRERDNKVPTMP